MAKELYVKVLSGPHLGAEMVLTPGEYLLGSSDACDIILHDETVMAEHGRLKITPEGEASLEPLAAIQKDGKVIPQEGEPVDPYVVFTLGTTSLCLGVKGEPWPEVKLPLWAMPQLAAAPAEAKAGAEAGAVPEEVQAEEAAVTPAEIKEELPPPPPPPSMLSRVGYIAAAVILVLLFGSGLVYLVRHWHVVPIVSLHIPTKSETINSVLQHFHVQTQLSVAVVSNRYVVSGYLPTERIMDDIQRELWNIDPQIKVEVYSTDAIEAASLDALHGLGLYLYVTSPVPGSVTISGCIPELTHWRDVKDKILRDVPGLTNINSQVMTVQEVVARIGDFAKWSGFGSIQFDITQKMLVAVGVVSQEHLAEWVDFKKSIETEYVHYISRLADYTGTKVAMLAKQRPITFRIKLINVGTVRWIVLDDGKKYFEGAKLPQDYILVTIEADGILIKNEQGLIHYKLDGTTA